VGGSLVKNGTKTNSNSVNRGCVRLHRKYFGALIMIMIDADDGIRCADKRDVILNMTFTGQDQMRHDSSRGSIIRFFTTGQINLLNSDYYL